MSKRVKGSLVAAAILGILICMVIMQWQGFSDDDDSAGDDDSAQADDDSASR
jgi:type II secretory pathway pseudopilin PulG